MLRKYNQFNSKRRIKKLTEDELRHCSELAEQVRYGGNPEHKGTLGISDSRLQTVLGRENPCVMQSAYFQDKWHWSIFNQACVKG